jgi:hypothetical protein
MYMELSFHALHNKHTWRFIMLSVITNTYNKKIKGPTLMQLLTATGKLRRFYICGFHTAVLYQIQELYTVQHNTLNVNTL